MAATSDPEKGKQTINSNSNIDKIDALNMIDDSKDSVHGNDVRRQPGARLRYNIYLVFAKISPKTLSTDFIAMQIFYGKLQVVK